MLAHAGSSIGHAWSLRPQRGLGSNRRDAWPADHRVHVLYRRGGYHHAFALGLADFRAAVSGRAHRCVRASPPARGNGTATRGALAVRPHIFAGPIGCGIWVAGALIAAGFADFSLIAFHFQQSATVAQDVIPRVLTRSAMATGAISALIIGKLLDRLGSSLPMLLVGLRRFPAFFAPLVFLAAAPASELVGMILWGHRPGRAGFMPESRTLAPIIPSAKRSTAFSASSIRLSAWPWFKLAAAPPWALLYDKSIPRRRAFLRRIAAACAFPVFVVASRTVHE